MRRVQPGSSALACRCYLQPRRQELEGRRASVRRAQSGSSALVCYLERERHHFLAPLRYLEQQGHHFSASMRLLELQGHHCLARVRCLEPRNQLPADGRKFVRRPQAGSREPGGVVDGTGPGREDPNQADRAYSACLAYKLAVQLSRRK